MNMKMRIMSIVAAGLLVISCGDSSKDDGLEGPFNLMSSVGKPSEGAKGYFEDIIYGDIDAPITIVEYASLTCSHCAAFHIDVLPELKKELLDTGRAKLVFRNFIRGPYDMAGAAFARCEDDMEKAKKWHGLFFDRQQDWYKQGVEPMQELAFLARKSGVSRAKFDQCAVNKDVQKYLKDMLDEATTKLQITATPTVYVNGMKLPDYRFETIKSAVENVEN